MGGRVGRFNHSEKFMAKMVQAMHQVTIDNVSKFLKRTDPATGKPRVLAATADKVTEQHRTGQAVGVLMFDKGEVKAAFVDYILAKDGIGKGLADELIQSCMHDTLRFTREELAQQLVGFAADGQYFANNGSEEIAKQLLPEVERNDHAAVQRMMEWLLCTWDAAHRLELTIGDVRKDKMCVARQINVCADAQREPPSTNDVDEQPSGPQEASNDSLRRSRRERRPTERARNAFNSNALAGVATEGDGRHTDEQEASEQAELEGDLPEVKRYALISQMISDIYSKFNYGKGFETLIDIAKEEEIVLYALKRFCDTRFAQSEHKVYQNFVRNYKVLLRAIRDKVATPRRRGGGCKGGSMTAFWITGSWER
jgi:hypothetical protein